MLLQYGHPAQPGLGAFKDEKFKEQVDHHEQAFPIPCHDKPSSADLSRPFTTFFHLSRPLIQDINSKIYNEMKNECQI